MQGEAIICLSLSIVILSTYPTTEISVSPTSVKVPVELESIQVKPSPTCHQLSVSYLNDRFKITTRVDRGKKVKKCNLLSNSSYLDWWGREQDGRGWDKWSPAPQETEPCIGPGGPSWDSLIKNL